MLKHGVLKIGSTKNIFHADGTPFLWLADSWWHGMTTLLKWPENFQTLTTDRKDKGLSVIQFAIGFPCDITEFDPRGANEAGFPTSQDYRRINPAYLDRVDLRVRHLVDQGMVPNILGTWGDYLPWFGQENMRRYWRYVIAWYGVYPVTWTVAGETTLTYYLLEPERKAAALRMQRDGWAEVARCIKKTDPFQRILTDHPGPSSGGFQPISDMSLLDIIMVQPGHRGWDDLPDAGVSPSFWSSDFGGRIFPGWHRNGTSIFTRQSASNFRPSSPVGHPPSPSESIRRWSRIITQRRPLSTLR
ncbi:putative endoglucanase [Crateriforma conspicua]|uniref:Putative endoglucanase n=1 Tax=Crateriforma conspicua TaxID=2527996 RepID=A0A5C6FQU1_9PLAN|nr:DUF4038 domain-containing protein [Crateriforma conspicua]TWU64616.1 putative endoglucanase [Crateriforma conspicua]